MDMQIKVVPSTVSEPVTSTINQERETKKRTVGQRGDQVADPEPDILAVLRTVNRV
jgi:hypothetical protein